MPSRLFARPRNVRRRTRIPRRRKTTSRNTAAFSNYFDAVKIGLTATPALHTVADFRRSDLHLFLSRSGDRRLSDRSRAADPHRDRAVAVPASRSRRTSRSSCSITRTGEIDLAHAPDEITFEVESVQQQVITKEFNRVVAEELAKHIDPSLPGKTLDLRRDRRSCGHRRQCNQEGVCRRLWRDRRRRRAARSQAALTASSPDPFLPQRRQSPRSR